ncbi:transposase [Streptomyces viridochromogenes]|nr:transposase [Streptomyces viridochromogenes]
MDPADQGEVLGLLDVRVTITGPVPTRTTNKGCTLTKWFADTGRLAPPALTDETWALVGPVIRAWEPPNHRLMDGRAILDAILFKARTGCGWHNVPTPDGLNWKTVHTRFNRWRVAGVWDEVMGRLPNQGSLPGTVVQPPPFKVTGRVDPRAMIGHEKNPRERVW